MAGIDPDIFFDDDGKVWYVGTAAPAKANFPGEGEIYCQELDLKDWKFTGERHYLWRGAVHGGVFVEGPHMYKYEGRGPRGHLFLKIESWKAHIISWLPKAARV